MAKLEFASLRKTNAYFCCSPAHFKIHTRQFYCLYKFISKSWCADFEKGKITKVLFCYGDQPRTATFGNIPKNWSPIKYNLQVISGLLKQTVCKNKHNDACSPCCIISTLQILRTRRQISRDEEKYTKVRYSFTKNVQQNWPRLGLIQCKGQTLQFYKVSAVPQ